MAIKLYEDGTTKELVIEYSANREERYPAFCELNRVKINADSLQIRSTTSGLLILDTNVYSNLTSSGGTPYASFAALKTEMDKYFDATA